MGYNEMIYHIKKNRWIMGTQLTPEVRTAELQNGQTSHSQKAEKNTQNTNNACTCTYMRNIM